MFSVKCATDAVFSVKCVTDALFSVKCATDAPPPGSVGPLLGQSRIEDVAPCDTIDL